MSLLSLDELRTLPSDANDYESGLYFLWSGGVLQYVGKATILAYRLYRHQRAHKYQPVRSFSWEKRIPYDRYTCLVIDSSYELSDRLRAQLIELEAEYIAAYRPPFNTSSGGGA